jgi:hypothetical protein
LNQVLLWLALVFRTTAAKTLKIVNDAPMSGKENRNAFLAAFALVVINFGLVYAKLKTSGPYTIKWKVLLPLCVELLAPVGAWLMMLEATGKFHKSK